MYPSNAKNTYSPKNAYPENKSLSISQELNASLQDFLGRSSTWSFLFPESLMKEISNLGLSVGRFNMESSLLSEVLALQTQTNALEPLLFCALYPAHQKEHDRYIRASKTPLPVDHNIDPIMQSFYALKDIISFLHHIPGIRSIWQDPSRTKTQAPKALRAIQKTQAPQAKMSAPPIIPSPFGSAFTPYRKGASLLRTDRYFDMNDGGGEFTVTDMKGKLQLSLNINPIFSILVLPETLYPLLESFLSNGFSLQPTASYDKFRWYYDSLFAAGYQSRTLDDFVAKHITPFIKFHSIANPPTGSYLTASFCKKTRCYSLRLMIEPTLSPFGRVSRLQNFMEKNDIKGKYPHFDAYLFQDTSCDVLYVHSLRSLSGISQLLWKTEISTLFTPEMLSSVDATFHDQPSKRPALKK